MGLAAAVIGAGAIGGIASGVTGAMNAGAVKSASNAQVTQDQAALALQQQQFGQTRADLAPFMQAGGGALGGLGDLTGANGGDAMTAAIEKLKSDPLYTSMVGQGDQAILANASATGGLRSGNTNYNLANLNAQSLAQVYQNHIGNLFNLAGLGENAASGAGSLGLGYAQTGTNTLGGIGSAQAGGIVGSSGALSGGINSGLSQLLSSLSMSKMLGGFGGGSQLGGAAVQPGGELDGLF